MFKQKRINSLIDNFEETNLINYKQKEIKSLNKLKEYRAEFQKLDNTIKSIVWDMNMG